MHTTIATTFTTEKERAASAFTTTVRLDRPRESACGLNDCLETRDLWGPELAYFTTLVDGWTELQWSIIVGCDERRIVGIGSSPRKDAGIFGKQDFFNPTAVRKGRSCASFVYMNSEHCSKI